MAHGHEISTRPVLSAYAATLVGNAEAEISRRRTFLGRSWEDA
jgi:hypothetical protein